MMKRIELVAQPKGLAFKAEAVDVDLDKLTPVARRLAELVSTTDRRDDASLVIVETVRTWAEIARSRGRSEEHIAKVRALHGAGYADAGQRERLAWPARISRQGVPTETGEAYFERVARLLTAAGWRIVEPAASRTVAA